VCAAAADALRPAADALGSIVGATEGQIMLRAEEVMIG
jgi:hypothetical protein